MSGSVSGDRWRFLRIGALISGLAAIAGIIANLNTIAPVFSQMSEWSRESIFSSYLSVRPFRDHEAKALLARRYGGVACFDAAKRVDLSGRGLKADLAVTFSRTANPGICNVDITPLDAAFFKSHWNGFKFVGDPELPHDADTATWSFAGPAAFREVTNSSHPDVEVFMLRNGWIQKVDAIGTFAGGGYRGTSYIETKDGRSAWVLNDAAITKISVGQNGSPHIENLDVKALVEGNQNLHVLSDNLDGLTFDGNVIESPYTVASESAGNAGDAGGNDDMGVVVKIDPGKMIYLIGCEPVRGLAKREDFPGAFLVELDKSPEALCGTGSEGDYTTKVKFAAY